MVKHEYKNVSHKSLKEADDYLGLEKLNGFVSLGYKPTNI